MACDTCQLKHARAIYTSTHMCMDDLASLVWDTISHASEFQCKIYGCQIPQVHAPGLVNL